MFSLPLIQPDNVFSAGFFLPSPRLKRAAGRYSSHDPVAHQFSFHAQQQVCRQALAKLARIIIHPFALSSVVSPDGFKTIGKRLDDGKIIFAEATKIHD